MSSMLLLCWLGGLESFNAPYAKVDYDKTAVS